MEPSLQESKKRKPIRKLFETREFQFPSLPNFNVFFVFFEIEIPKFLFKKIQKSTYNFYLLWYSKKVNDVTFVSQIFTK